MMPGFFGSLYVCKMSLVEKNRPGKNFSVRVRSIRISFLIGIMIAMIFFQSGSGKNFFSRVCSKKFHQGPVVKS